MYHAHISVIHLSILKPGTSFTISHHTLSFFCCLLSPKIGSKYRYLKKSLDSIHDNFAIHDFDTKYFWLLVPQN